MTQLSFTSYCRCLAVIASLMMGSSVAFAQTGKYHEPLSEKLPPGYAADVLARIRHQDMHWLQPVRVELPSAGMVSVYSASPDSLASLDSPAQFSVNVGHLYRLRISDMPELPGVEIYPSIEILDRLHPPEGQAANYPIPIVFSAEDLKEATEGRLVTRVVYLEEPKFASQLDRLRSEFPQTLAPTDNALQEAGRMGRPMIIVRIGGRVPAMDSQMPMIFFGTGGGVDLGESLPANTGVVRFSDRTKSAGRLASHQQ